MECIMWRIDKVDDILMVIHIYPFYKNHAAMKKSKNGRNA
jgi:hypothetical protein